MARLDVSSLGSYIREQRTNAELSIRELARVAGVSNPYLSQVERGIRQPSAQTLSRVADALRISAEQLYVRAGFLDRNHEHSVKAAIMDDPYLTEVQREDLLSRYESYVGANGLATVKKPATKPATTSKRPPVKKTATAKKTTTAKTPVKAARKAGASKPGTTTKTDRTSRRTERGPA